MGGGRRDAATGAIREFALFVPTPRAFEGGAEDVVENVAAFACELVKHREGEQLEAKDLQLVLEKNWNMRLPGVGDTSELKAIKKTSSTEVHRQRLQMVRRRGR